jgi:hypothetical protein
MIVTAYLAVAFDDAIEDIEVQGNVSVDSEGLYRFTEQRAWRHNGDEFRFFDLTIADQAAANCALEHAYEEECKRLHSELLATMQEATAAIDRALDVGATDELDDFLEEVRAFRRKFPKRREPRRPDLAVVRGGK